MSSGESGVLRRLELAGRRDAEDPGGCNMVLLCFAILCCALLVSVAFKESDSRVLVYRKCLLLLASSSTQHSKIQDSITKRRESGSDPMYFCTYRTYCTGTVFICKKSRIRWEFSCEEAKPARMGMTAPARQPASQPAKERRWRDMMSPKQDAVGLFVAGNLGSNKSSQNLSSRWRPPPFSKKGVHER
jgi:hypothetical protein